MKKLYVAALGLALLSTGTVVFAQNTATGTDTMSNGTMSKKHKKSKKNKGTMSDTAGTASSTK